MRLGRRLTAAVAALALIGTGIPATALAGGKYSHGYKGYYGSGYYSGYHRFGHGKGFHRGYRGHHRHKGHGAGYAVLGAGLGLLLFSAINQSNRDRGYNRGYRDDDYYYRQAQPPRYIPPPEPRARTARPSREEAFAGMDCLQIREYTTTIVIGGEEKDAYGDACLQPDGSWIPGQPKVVPEFGGN